MFILLDVGTEIGWQAGTLWFCFVHWAGYTALPYFFNFKKNQEGR